MMPARQYVISALAAACLAAAASAESHLAPAVRYVDLDGDGLIDRISAGGLSGTVIELNRGSGYFEAVPQAEPLPPVAVRDVLVSDLDADRHHDLYLVGPGPNVALLGDGRGHFRDATAALGLADQGHGLSAERLDVDGDGRDELLLHNATGDVLFWAESTGFRRQDPEAAEAGAQIPASDLEELLESLAAGRIQPARLGDQALVFSATPTGGFAVSLATPGSVTGGVTSPAGFGTTGLSLDDLKSLFVDEGQDVTALGDRLGVGAVVPEAALHVSHPDARILLADADDPVYQMSLRVNGGGTNYVYASGKTSATLDLTPLTGDTTSGATVRLFRGTSTSGTKRVQFFKGDDTTTLHAQVGVDGAPTFFAGGGHVGIGTTSPEYPLHVRTGTDVTKSTGGYLMVGDSKNRNLAFDGDEIQARNNGAATHLSLNAEGGDVKVCNNGTGILWAPKIRLTGGADLVEGFEAHGADPQPGMVVVVAADGSGRVSMSTRAYDPAVIGVVSGAGGVEAGLELGQAGVADGDIKVAMVGRVYVRCTADGGPIRPGDRLVTSGRPGVAMRASDSVRTDGAVLGKAFGTLESGEGLVLVTVNLQ